MTFLNLVPLITEKSTAGVAENKYVFIIDATCNKISLKQFLEKEYKIKVLSINLANYYGKNRRVGRFTGKTKDYKKAVVTLYPGERFEAMEGLF